MITWDDLKFVLALYKHRTMTAAAKSLKANVATVSRRIERLSEDFGQPVFLKKADHWDINPAMRGLAELAEDIEARLAQETNKIMRTDANHVQTISVGAPPVINTFLLFPQLQAGKDMLPGVNLRFSNRIFEEGLGDNDIMLTFRRPESGRLIIRSVGTLTLRPYKHKGQPIGHDWVGLTEEHDILQSMKNAHRVFGGPPSIRVENFQQLAAVMESARLPGPLPEFVAVNMDGIEPVATPDAETSPVFWLCYHESRRGDVNLHRTADWIKLCFQKVSPEQLK